MRFSRLEVEQLVKAWLLVSIAFAIVQLGGLQGIIYYGLPGIIVSLLISLFATGTGFGRHELSHKLFAQRYAHFAEFRYDLQQILFALVISMFGFLFVAPGAVYMHGYITKRQNGIISLSGPAANMLLAAIMLALGLAANVELLKVVFLYTFQINSWLALFNLIPIMNFDGAKILAWNKLAFGLAIAAAGLLSVLGYMLV